MLLANYNCNSSIDPCRAEAGESIAGNNAADVEDGLGGTSSASKKGTFSNFEALGLDAKEVESLGMEDEEDFGGLMARTLLYYINKYIY